MTLASATSGHRLNNDPTSDKPTEASLPPLLRWALFSTTNNEADSSDSNALEVNTELRALQMAATVYRERAIEKSRFITKAIPIIACILVGGTVVFAYALTVWAPLVALINELCSGDTVMGGF